MENKKKYTSIGGQALIEGVMMRGSKVIAISVRKPDGEIETKIEKLNPLFSAKFFKLPIIRGAFALIDAMVIGIKAITYSAEIQNPEDYEKGKFELFLDRHFGNRGEKIMMGLSVTVSLLLAVFLFGMLPSFIINLLKSHIGDSLVLSLLEGVLKFFMFLSYILLISRMKEIQRVFQYHGAEHKTIACFEAGESLEPRKAKEKSRLHPRCGTSFLIYVMAISIILFSFVTWSNVWVRIGLKLLILPVVSGLAYEVIKISARYIDNRFFCYLAKPGLMLQNLTTAEPDEAQLEVAIAAMQAVLDEEHITKLDEDENAN